MTDDYILMHKDVPCGAVVIDRDSGALTRFSVIDNRYTPFLGNADKDNMKVWWNHRAVPGSRRDMEEVVRNAGCETNSAYLAKNLALSITDTYWICPADITLSWKDVSLHKGTAGGNVVILHNGTSYDPNASLGGQMNKFWDLSGDRPVLVKRAYENYGQQGVNELFATEVHIRQGKDVSFVSYRRIDADDNAVPVCCDSFTSENVEFVPAYEVLRSRKLRSGRYDADSFIDICEENGLDRKEMQHFLDYLILSDFAVSNTDEHLQNFGVLRNTETMELIGPAPVFDTGNSMFFSEKGIKPLSRTELLSCRISSFHSEEEKMLKHVKDRKVLDPQLLPSQDEVRSFYESNGISAERASFIAGSYANKISMLQDFTNGITISLYNEKQREKKKDQLL